MENVTQTFNDWQLFYATIAGVTATLSGLLFVAISLNMDVFSRDNLHYQRLARLTLSKFLYLLVISLVCILPLQSSHGVGITTVIMCGMGAWDTCGYIVQSRKKEGSTFYSVHVIPFITYIVMIALAIGLMIRFDSDWLYWLAAAVIVMMISAARNAWDLMLKIPKA